MAEYYEFPHRQLQVGSIYCGVMDRLTEPSPEDHPYRWQEGAIVYQIYPRSFQDSNDDGIGDLPGIKTRLEYLSELGVNALWLSPFYPSPMADFGYDVADYCNVDPMFGTLDDFRDVLRTAHEKEIKVIVDLVPNHTSDDHPWFKASRQSRNNEYADWYIWRDAKPESEPENPLPPNNWRDALTGGSAWQWEPERQQFYLHSFDVRQPDLNWANRDVHEAMKDIMRFWLDLGVDGFRVDAVYWMGKDTLFRDDSINPEYIEGTDPPYEALAHDKSQGQPQVYAHLSHMAEVLKEPKYRHRPCFMITEAYPPRHNPIADYLTFYACMDPQVAAPFNFEGISLPWEGRSWQRFLQGFHSNLSRFGGESVASYAFGNHDQPRLVSRIGEQAARSAAVMLLTLPGMVFIYYGEEIGMKDSYIPFENVQDPAAKGDPSKGQGRDPQRTPMQWSGNHNAGFTNVGTPWLPIAHDYGKNNVDVQLGQEHSFLALYRRLGQLRNNSESLKHGSIEVLEIEHPDVVGYIRHHSEDDPYLTLMNFSDHEVILAIDIAIKELIISSNPQSKLSSVSRGDRVALLAYEGALLRVDQTNAGDQ